MVRTIDQVSGDIRKELSKATFLVQALRITGVKLRRHIEGAAVANCPFPVHTFRSPSLIVSLDDPEHFSCEVCGVKGGVRTYVEAFCAESSGTLGSEPVITSVLRSQVSATRSSGVQTGESIKPPVTSDNQVVEVYEALSYEMDLQDGHAYYLAGRGLLAVTCFENGYRSLPASRERRIAICDSLIAGGYCLQGVPGFFRIPDHASNPNLRGRWCIGGDHIGRRAFKGRIAGEEVRYEVGGILIPVRNASSRIERYEMLNDLSPSEIPETLKALWPPRLSLLMSSGNGGQLSGTARLHHVGPVSAGGEFADAVWATDSALRADILSAEFGARVIGVTSLGHLWKETAGAISGYQRTIIAISHKEVLFAARLCREAARLGIESFITSWEREETFNSNELWLPNDYWAPVPYEQWWAQLPSETRNQVESELLACV